MSKAKVDGLECALSVRARRQSELDERLREHDMAQKNSPTNKPPPKQTPKGKVVTGAAAVAEMAAMERAAKRQQSHTGARVGAGSPGGRRR
jgi:hypothetical protein